MSRIYEEAKELEGSNQDALSLNLHGCSWPFFFIEVRTGIIAK
jgi:hypothetical protein